MVNVLALFGIIFASAAIPTAIGYFLWAKFRPKKLSWQAWVYQPSEAKFKDEKQQVELSKLQLYAKDTIVRDVGKSGGIVYRLVSMNKSVPQPTPDVIENVPNIGKIIKVLYVGDTCTLLKSGYDEKKGLEVWNPLPYDRYTSLKQDMALQMERLTEKKDLLAQLLPYIAIVIAFMAIIGLGYMVGSSQVKIAKENRLAVEAQSETQEKTAEIMREAFIDIANAITGTNVTAQAYESLGAQT